MIDGVPFGPSNTYNFGGSLYPDIDPSDLARIEVLRGPQGTLYGADSIGGLINIVTVEPSTAALSGRIDMMGEGIDGGGAGFGVHGSVNLPLTDSFAIRVSAFTHLNPGFTKNELTGRENVDWSRVEGGRVATLWQPADNVSLKLSALYQHTYSNSNPWENTGLSASGDLTPVPVPFGQTYVPGTNWSVDSVSQYAATLNVREGGIDITSITAYGINQYHQLFDLTVVNLQSLPLPMFAGDNYAILQHFPEAKFTEELRMSSTWLNRIDWTVGFFYEHDNDNSDQTGAALNPTTGQIVGAPVSLIFKPDSLNEWAIFADATYHFTDKLSLQIGGRRGEEHQVWQQSLTTGPAAQLFYLIPSGTVLPADYEKGTPVTYLITPEYKISNDLMTYGRVSTGYRNGGYNLSFPASPVPTSYQPDKSTNYELGFKGSFFNKRMTTDFSVYDIQWRDLQLGEATPLNSFYTTNAGAAESQGVEASVELTPASGLTVGVTGSYNHAKLTQTLPVATQLYGPNGARLPYSPMFTGSLTAEERFQLSGAWDAFVGGTLSYVDSRVDAFTGSASQPRLHYPSYTKTNIHLGVQYETWKANLFINNVTDEHAILSGGGTVEASNTSGYYAVVTQPRMFGLNLSKTF
jgi:iron complex outermembrane receptor protein